MLIVEFCSFKDQNQQWTGTAQALSRGSGKMTLANNCKLGQCEQYHGEEKEPHFEDEERMGFGGNSEG